MQKNNTSKTPAYNASKAERWLIVGAGAIGLLWYSKLHRSGHNVTILHRNHTPLTYIDFIEQNTKQTINVNSMKITDMQPVEESLFSHILFCTKSFDLVSAYQETRRFFNQDAHIACLCNGMGAQQDLQEQLDKKHHLFVGVTSEGALKTKNNEVYKTGEGETHFGQLIQTTTSYSFLIQSFYTNDIQAKLIAKLAVNAAINPLTALFEIQNGLLLSKEYVGLFSNSCDEIDSILRKSELSAISYKKMSEAVAFATKDNKSSMLQDRLHQRKTELNYICGYLVKEARVRNIAAPIQTALIKALTGEVDKEEIKKWLLGST